MRIILPLRRKFLLFILVLAIIPLLLVSLFSFRGSRRALLETISINNTSFTLGTARGIRDEVLNFRAILESAAQSVVMAETLEEKKDTLISYKKGFLSIESLAILDKQGRETVRSDNEPLEDRSEKPEFYMLEKEDFYFSWLKYNEEQALSSVILSVPILKEDKFEGVLVGEIFLYEIWDQAMIASLSPDDNCYVFTQEGEIVAKITASKEEFRSSELERIALDAAFGGKLFTKEQKTEIGSMLVIASPVPVLNWELVIFRPTTEIYEPASRIRNEAMIIIFFSLIFISIITLLFSRTIVTPIRKLHEGVGIIAKGHLDHKFDIKTGDEIEELANEFNQMTKSLKESKVGLEARIKQLERFHKLTVGRELRMVALKEEIKKLKKELEKYKEK
jgi:nitrogen fixation/metabolism regulation signal transduction histidine kinase